MSKKQYKVKKVTKKKAKPNISIEDQDLLSDLLDNDGIKLPEKKEYIVSDVVKKKALEIVNNNDTQPKVEKKTVTSDENGNKEEKVEQVILDSYDNLDDTNKAYVIRSRSLTTSLGGCRAKNDDGSSLFSTTETVSFIIPCHVKDVVEVSKCVSTLIGNELKEIQKSLSRKIKQMQGK